MSPGCRRSRSRMVSTKVHMTEFRLPYGHDFLTARLDHPWTVDVITPNPAPAAPDPLQVVGAALDRPAGGVSLAQVVGAAGASPTVAVAVNDKTRPVPHGVLLPPLLQRLEALGVAPAAITFIIATGTHAPMVPEEYPAILPPEILGRYRVICHDADDAANLVRVGATSRGTPIWVNRLYLEADVRLVIGNIEPHQFEGFSGGVKSAAIGLGGRATVDGNHALLTDPLSTLGEYARNPARQEVEEIGQRIGVHWALNAILNDEKKLVHAVAGYPVAVMEVGIPLARAICQVEVRGGYDLVVAAAGGHPKDINLYQAQKALAHASVLRRPGGEMVLVAACPEGVGSRGYEAWMEGVPSYEAVFDKFSREGFRVGPHKAFLVARDASRGPTQLVSQMPPEAVRKLLLEPAASLDAALAVTQARRRQGGRAAIVTRANATIPMVDA
jgi:nickel-dependent lactate racemase